MKCIECGTDMWEVSEMHWCRVCGTVSDGEFNVPLRERSRADVGCGMLVLSVVIAVVSAILGAWLL